MREIDQRLLDLSDHLEFNEAERLRQLVAAKCAACASHDGGDDT